MFGGDSSSTVLRKCTPRAKRDWYWKAPPEVSESLFGSVGYDGWQVEVTPAGGLPYRREISDF